MALLEVPLEAALRLYSLPGADAGATVSAWAWAAALLAAVLGLWGIRAVGSKSHASPHSISPSAAAAVPPPQPSPSLGPVARPVPAPPTDRHSGEASPTKARYTAYYHGGPPDDSGAAEEDESDFDDEDEEDGGDRYGGKRRVEMTEGGSACWQEGWMAEARRRWDLGWYRFLDTTALDGSVVRLWDGGDGGTL